MLEDASNSNTGEEEEEEEEGEGALRGSSKMFQWC